MTPTARGEVDDLLESEESWPERTMLRVSTAKECLATESAQSKIDQPWCVTRQPTPHGYRWNRRALFATTRTRDQHQYLDTAPLLQECRSALQPRSQVWASIDAGFGERGHGRLSDTALPNNDRPKLCQSALSRACE